MDNITFNTTANPLLNVYQRNFVVCSGRAATVARCEAKRNFVWSLHNHSPVLLHYQDLASILHMLSGGIITDRSNSVDARRAVCRAVRTLQTGLK